MAHPYFIPQAAMTPYIPATVNRHEAHPQYHIFAPAQYPESIALWHIPPSQQHLTTSTYTAAYSSRSSSPYQFPALHSVVDQKKHKRTRSGCFTCRSRRIKCDEARPICGRCRKGNRDCTYPPPPHAGSRHGAKAKGSRTPSSEGDSPSRAESDDVNVLAPIADEDEDDERSVGSGSRPSKSPAAIQETSILREQNNSPPRERKRQIATETKENSSSPSTKSPGAVYMNIPPTDGGGSQLPEDLRFYLSFHHESMSYHHFFQKQDSGSFFSKGIIDLAMQYEPLLYAVVGYAAYHHCMRAATRKLSIFLNYYNKALLLLRTSLGSGEKHGEATLVTALVLATFEESIGDFVSLIDHHQAAHALMQELLTPDSVNICELHSVIFLWYARFDIVAGLLAGSEMILGREWYVSKEMYDSHQVSIDPDHPQKRLAWAMSIIRRVALDMASLHAKHSRGLISLDEFSSQNTCLAEAMERVECILRSYDNSEHTVMSYPHQQPLSNDDIVDPYRPGGLYCGPLWGVNFVWMDYLGTMMWFKYQSSVVLGQPLPVSELESLAIEQCRLIEAIERWPQKESGCIISSKNSLGLLCLFLPMDEKYIMWCRRKFALTERNGYIETTKLRASLAAIWQIPEINHWWLPNEEGYIELICDIRAMTEERMNNPRDQFREDVRDMKSVFGKMKLDDAKDGVADAARHSD